MPGMVVPRPVFLDPMRSKLVAWLAQKLGIVESYDCMARYGRYRLTAQPSSQPGEKTWTRLPSRLLERNSVKKKKKTPDIGDMLLDMAKSHVCEADMTRQDLALTPISPNFHAPKPTHSPQPPPSFLPPPKAIQPPNGNNKNLPRSSRCCYGRNLIPPLSIQNVARARRARAPAPAPRRAATMLLLLLVNRRMHQSGSPMFRDPVRRSELAEVSEFRTKHGNGDIGHVGKQV